MDVYTCVCVRLCVCTCMCARVCVCVLVCVFSRLLMNCFASLALLFSVHPLVAAFVFVYILAKRMRSSVSNYKHFITYQ